MILRYSFDACSGVQMEYYPLTVFVHVLSENTFFSVFVVTGHAKKVHGAVTTLL
jgi:hypothetical protein